MGNFNRAYAQGRIPLQSKRGIKQIEPLCDDSGQALVEVAVSCSLMVLLLGGMCICGLLEYDSIEVMSSARAGVQFGAQSRITATDTAGMRAAAVQDAPNVPALTATAGSFCQCSDGSTSTCLGTDCPTSHIVEYVKVNTQAAVTPPFHISFLSGVFTLKGQAIMRVGH